MSFLQVDQLPQQGRIGHAPTRLDEVGGAGAIAAAASEYIPQSGALADQLVAHTRLLGPGETDTITCTLAAGVY